MVWTFKQKFNAYLGMSKRNVLIFFRDKTTVFFSMLAPLIVLFLYLVFLKNTYVNVIKDNLEGLENYINANSIDTFTNLWLLSGILGTSCITVSLNSLGIMVEDKSKKIDYDYNASPISGPIVVLAYFTGALINTFLIDFCILSFGLIILSIISDVSITFSSVVMLYLILFLGCVSSTLIMMLIVSFFKRNAALGAFSGIVSAGAGFFIGAYMPVSEFSDSIQIVCNILPGSHVAGLFRNYLMTGILDDINTQLNGIDSGMFVNTLKDTFSFKLNFFTLDFGIVQMFIYIIITAIIALFIDILLYKKH